MILKSPNVINENDKQTGIISILYAIFIFSGVLKNIFSMLNVYFFDITILSGLLLFLVLLKNINKVDIKRNEFQVIIAFIVFLSWYIFTYTYTEASGYGVSKILGSVLNCMALCIPLITRVSFSIFTRCVFVLTLLVSILSIYYRLYIPYSEYNDNIKRSYLVAGYLSGYLLLSSLFMDELKSKVIYSFTSIALLFLLGARGPLLFSFLFLSVFGLFYFKNIALFLKNNFLKTIIFFVIGSIVTYIAINNFSSIDLDSLIDRTVGRLLLLFSDDHGNSVDERVYYLNRAWEMISQRPFFGFGIGGFATFENGLDSALYPHNLILELWSETGIIGLILFMLFLLILYVRSSRLKLMFFVVVGYGILNALKSYGFEDLRIAFSFMGIVLSLATIKKKVSN